MTDDEVKQQKEIQFFGAAMGAWVNTALEHDKSLLTLSAGGIGLLVTLLSTVGVGNVVLLVLYIAAMLAFLACVVGVLGVFRRNKTHIKQVVDGKGDPDPILRALDAAARASFGIGAILTTIIGISTAALSYTASEGRMSNERVTREGTVDFGKSLNNIGGLRPSTGGASAQTPAPAPAPASAPEQQTTNNSGSGSGSK